MSFDNIFTVKNEDLERLDAQGAVEFFAELLRAEANKLGIPFNNINISNQINVPDGGIDATVNYSGQFPEGLIKNGLTSYQIKASEAFSPWQPSAIKKELFSDKDVAKINLGPSVKNCLDKNGTYVLVCFKNDLVESQLPNAKEHLTEYFKQCGYTDPKVEVLSQNQIISFISAYPSLSLKINERDQSKFQSYLSWSSNDDVTANPQYDEKHKDLIKKIHSELRKSQDKSLHLRLLGEPGVGKTKLVFEALKEPDLNPLVLYCINAESFFNSILYNELLKEDNKFHVILVIDECNSENRAIIHNVFKNKSAKIKIISIFYECEITSEITYFEFPELEKACIINILKEHGVPEEKVTQWAELCGTSPRVAHVIGENLKNNIEDLLQEPSSTRVWERYIVGNDDPQSENIRRKRTIIQFISLFKKLGYERAVAKEAKIIYEIINKADNSISEEIFNYIIKDFRNKKILQGSSTLYITPKALHIKMWMDWWELHPIFDFKPFFEKLTPQLIKWFGEMLKYANSSEFTSRIINEIFNENGPFKDIDLLKTELGSSFFLSITEANPRAALKFLKKTIAKWNIKELSEFQIGRREIIFALEKIVVWNELFHDAARLLLILGEAENETWGNNASNVFANLFNLHFASTETPPEDRLIILDEAFSSDSNEKKRLAIRALNVSLENGQYIKLINDSVTFQGLGKQPKFWMPKDNSEHINLYKKYWNYLKNKLFKLKDELFDEALEALLKHFREFCNNKGLAQTAIDTIKELSQNNSIDKKSLLVAVTHVIHYDGKRIDKTAKVQLDQLNDSLTGSDFTSLLKRYVGMDLLEDEFDEDGRESDKTTIKTRKLAEQCISDNNLLKCNLDWLMSKDAVKGYKFGYELAKLDNKNTLLPILIDAQKKYSKKESVYFISGYIRCIHENDNAKWDNLLESFTNDEIMSFFIPEITWRTGMTDSASLRMLKIIAQKNIDITIIMGFANILSNNITSKVFEKWIEYFLNFKEINSYATALEFFLSYYQKNKISFEIPKNLTFVLLTSPLIYTSTKSEVRNKSADYYWQTIAKLYIDKYSDMHLDLFKTILENFNKSKLIFSGVNSDAENILDLIVYKNPDKVWDIIKQFLLLKDQRGFYIKKWLRGNDIWNENPSNKTPFACIPLDKIFSWVDEDINKRAIDLASFVPNKLFKEEGVICLAREVLARYGNNEKVRENLMSNFLEEGWTGYASEHYSNKKQKLIDFKNLDSNIYVKQWIDEFVDYLDGRIEHEKISEEREY